MEGGLHWGPVRLKLPFWHPLALPHYPPTFTPSCLSFLYTEGQRLLTVEWLAWPAFSLVLALQHLWLTLLLTSLGLSGHRTLLTHTGHLHVLLPSLFLSTPTGHIPGSRYRRQMIFGQREVLAEKREDGCELPARSALRCPQDAQACSALFLPPSNVNSFLSCLPVCFTICWFPQFWLCFPGSLFTKESFFK